MLEIEELKRLQNANRILNSRYKDLGLKPLDFGTENTAHEQIHNETKVLNKFISKELEAKNNTPELEALDLNSSETLENISVEPQVPEAKTVEKTKQIKEESKVESSLTKELLEDELASTEDVKEANELLIKELQEMQLEEKRASKKASPKKNTASKLNLLSLFFVISMALLMFFNPGFRTSTVNMFDDIFGGIFDGFKRPTNVPVAAVIEKAKAGEIEEQGVFRVVSLKEKEFVISSGTFLSEAEAMKSSKEISKLAGNTLKIVRLGKFFTIQIGPKYKSYEQASVVFKEIIKYPIADISIKVLG